MKKPTLAQINQSEVLGEYFFSRKTLRFFGQKMSNFKTEWHDKEKGILRVYAISYMREHGTRQPPQSGLGITEHFVEVDNTGRIIQKIPKHCLEVTA